jgi:ketosteroid isomerase-like protein
MSPAGEQALLARIDAPRAAGVPLGERLAATPRLACEALCRAINHGDLEAALACFSPGAGLLGSEGSLAQGEGAIAAHLAELIARGAHVQIELRGVLVAADLALAHERWQLTYAGVPDPATAKAPGPTLVLRLIAGEWRIAIAAPWGAPATAPLRAIWP